MKKKILPFTLITVLSFNLCPVSFAAEGTAGDYTTQIGTKFSRGLWNVISSPAEIPCTTSKEISDKGGTVFFSGFGKGIVFMLRRIWVGVDEVGTFMIPMEATLPPVCSK